jgi:RNA polymerase sigma-70 factor (ECF subfamily)
LSIREHETRFRQWLAEHTGLLIKVVRSFAEGPADADDLFQEVLLQVWMSLPNYREESKPTTWLYRVALNTALMWKRRETKHRAGRQTLSSKSLAIEDHAIVPGVGGLDENVQRLYDAVRALPAANRALVLLYLDGMSYSEIAEVIGISETNVGVRLNRIKKQLAGALKEPTDVS